MPPLATLFVAAVAFALACWAASLVTGNCSQVDRLWSILPPLYVAGFAAAARFADARLDLMLLLSAAWGARLTANFARKGGYRPGAEDYRWPVLRGRMSKATFQLFNLLFISLFQNLQLALLALPAAEAFARRAPLNAVDIAAVAAFVLLLVGETVADNQQWRFQEAKRLRREHGDSGRPRFLTEGLFRYSRHPNFFCEMGMWWCFYLFSIGAGAPPLNASLAGPVLLTLLFQGSTGFTESLSLAKYPEYADYQRTTSRLVPLPPRRRDG